MKEEIFIMKKGFLALVLTLALVLGLSGSAFAAPLANSVNTYSSGTVTFKYDAADSLDLEAELLAGPGLSPDNYTFGVDTITTINASGPLDEYAWAYLVRLIGTVPPASRATVNVSTTAAIDAALSNNSVVTGSDQVGGPFNWDDVWNDLASNGNITLNATLDGAAADANALLNLVLQTVPPVHVESLALKNGAKATIPEDLDVGTIVVDKDSALDLSKFTHLNQLEAFAVGTLDLADGSKLGISDAVLPPGTSVSDIVDELEKIFGVGNVPAVNVYSLPSGGAVPIATSSQIADEVARRSGHSSSGGCDAGLGFAGLMAMAGIALLRRKG
jgi:hypothetical protein